MEALFNRKIQCIYNSILASRKTPWLNKCLNDFIYSWLNLLMFSQIINRENNLPYRSINVIYSINTYTDALWSCLDHWWDKRTNLGPGLSFPSISWDSWVNLVMSIKMVLHCLCHSLVCVMHMSYHVLNINTDKIFSVLYWYFQIFYW